MRVPLALVACLALTSVASANEKPTYAGSQRTITERLTVARGQLRVSTLASAPNLRFTREVLERPGSDWGMQGLGKVFAEKRSALTNLRWAAGHLAAASQELATARGFVGRWNVGRKLWLGTTARTIAGLEGDVATARQALRVTGRVWRSLGVLTYSATRDQREILRAVLEDLHTDQAAIDRHLDEYIKARYGP